MQEILNMLMEYKNYSTNSGYFFEKRKTQQFNLFQLALEEEVLRNFHKNETVKQNINAAWQKAKTNHFQPFVMARKIAALFFKQTK